MEVYSFDPYAKYWSTKFKTKYNIQNKLSGKKFDVVILAVKHKSFLNKRKKIKSLCGKSGFIYDLKYLFPEHPNIYRL